MALIKVNKHLEIGKKISSLTVELYIDTSGCIISSYMDLKTKKRYGEIITASGGVLHTAETKEQIVKLIKIADMMRGRYG